MRAGTRSTALLAQEAGEEELVELLRQGRGGGVDRRGIAAQGHRHGHAPAEAFVPAVVLGAHLVRVPVHPGGAVVEHLHAVHARRCAGRSRGAAVMTSGKREEAPAVLGPALEHGEVRRATGAPRPPPGRGPASPCAAPRRPSPRAGAARAASRGRSRAAGCAAGPRSARRSRRSSVTPRANAVRASVPKRLMTTG